MEDRSPETARPKTRKGRCNLNGPKPERVSRADLNGCLLVLPECFGMKGSARFTEGDLEGITLKLER
jgi:hypothetical protein